MRKTALLSSLFVLALIGLPAGLFTTLPTAARESTWRITIWANPDHTFDAVFPFHGGLSGVEFFTEPEDITFPHILGYVDRDGEVVIPIIHPHTGPWYMYRGAPHFTYCAAAIFSNDHWAAAIFDSSGQQLTDFIFGDARNFSEGLVAVHDIRGWAEGRWGFADTSGNIVIPMIFQEAMDFVGGLAPVALNGRWMLIDTDGERVPGFDAGVYVDGHGFTYTPGFSQGLLTVVAGFNEHCWPMFSVLDIDGNVIVPPGIYDHIQPFSQGLAAVRVGDWDTGYWGFINTEGAVVIPPNPDWLWVHEFSDGLAAVRVVVRWDGNRAMDWEYGFINTRGEFVIQPVFREARPFNDGLAAVNVGAWREPAWGIIDLAGNWVIQPIYSQVSDFSEGLIWLGTGERGDMQWSIAAVERVRPESGTRHGLIDRVMRLLRR